MLETLDEDNEDNGNGNADEDNDDGNDGKDSDTGATGVDNDDFLRVDISSILL